MNLRRGIEAPGLSLKSLKRQSFDSEIDSSIQFSQNCWSRQFPWKRSWPLFFLTFLLLFSLSLRLLLFTHFGDFQEADIFFPPLFGIREGAKKN